MQRNGVSPRTCIIPRFTSSRQFVRGMRFLAWSRRSASVEGFVKRILEKYGDCRDILRQLGTATQPETSGTFSRYRPTKTHPCGVTITVNEAYTSSFCARHGDASYAARVAGHETRNKNKKTFWPKPGTCHGVGGCHGVTARCPILFVKGCMNNAGPSPQIPALLFMAGRKPCLMSAVRFMGNNNVLTPESSNNTQKTATCRMSNTKSRVARLYDDFRLYAT
jgi:hypothetical protein